MSSWNNNIGISKWSNNTNTTNINNNLIISSIQTNYISSGLIQSGILSTLNLNVSSINGSNINVYNNSNWSKYPAIQDVNIANHNINNIATTNTNAIVVGNGGQLWNGNAQFNGTGNLFSPYWYNFIMDANITTGQQTQQYPPTNQQYFSQYDVTHNSYDAQSVFSNLTFNNAHLGINSQGVAVLPVGNVILESKNYTLNLPYVNPPISYLAGSYRGSAYLGVNGYGPSAYIRMNYDSIGNYIPNNSALVEINADSVTGVTPLASSRVRTTAGKCDMIGTYGATMTAGTYINPAEPNLNSNYRATAEFQLYGYSIVGIPEPITGNAGTATLTVTGSNRLTNDTYGNSVITITATRATTNTLGYNATVNINADDHIYLNSYRIHLNGNENYIGNKLIGFNSLDIQNVNSIQVSNVYNDGGINILSDLLLNNNSIYNVNSISNLGYINILTDLDLSNHNIYHVNNLTASNVNTSTINTFSLNTSTINIMSNNTSFIKYINNTYTSTFYNSNTPIIPSYSFTNPYNSVYAVSSITSYNYIQVSNYINTSNVTRIIDTSNYYLYTANSNTAYTQAFINTLTTTDTFGLDLRILFGWVGSTGASNEFGDFINQGNVNIGIEPAFPNSLIDGYYNIGLSNTRGYSKASTSNILFSNITIPPYVYNCNVSSLYLSQVSTIQAYSSITQSITFSKYDTNGIAFSGLGEYILDCSVLKVNNISSGTISGGVPFSNNNLTVDSISTNRISTGVLQTNQIIFDNNGTAGLSTFNNFYRGYGGLLALSNVDFYLNKQDIVGVTTGDFERVSTISTISKIGLFSTLKTNYLNVSSISGNQGFFSSISTGSIIGGISQTNINSTIDGLGTLGYISSSQLTSTVRGLGNIYVSSIQGSIQSDITSSITGLGTLGYISSSQLTSTVRGLGQIYVSSIQGSIQSDITSSITGLGTIGYVSSSQLTSTVRGLGNIYVSTPSLVSTIVGWAGIPANKNVNLYGNDILNINNLFTDVISPSHSDYVSFPSNGISTDFITAYSNPYIGFNNDANILGNNIIDVNQISVDYISGFSNPYVSFPQPIFVDFINPYTTDSNVTFPSGIQVDNLYSITSEINFNNNVFFGGHDLSGANNFSFIGTNPIYPSGSSGTDNDIIVQNSIDMSNNSIINLFDISTDYITANSNTIIGITSPLDLNYRNINNVSNISLDFLSNNSNRAIEVFSDFTIDGTLNVVNITNGLGYLDFSDNNLRNIPRIDFNYAGNNGGIGITSNPFRSGSLLYISNADFTFANQNIYNAGSYTGTNISTINISTSVITTQEIYTKNLGNNNPYAVQSIIVNNDFNMGQNNISNANTLTTSNISTINISTASLFTSSLTVSTINNYAYPLLQFGSGTNNNTITLPKRYANTNYQILLTQRGSSAIIPLYSSNITTSNFYVGGSAGSYQFSWMTTGY